MTKAHPYAFSLMVQWVSVLFFLPLAIGNFKFPETITPWIVLAIAAVIWVIISLCSYTAHKKTEASIKKPLDQTKIIWALLFGAFILKEAATWNRIIGTILIFIGACFLLWHPEKKFGRLRDSGIKWTLLTAFLLAVVAIIDKYALTWFVPEVYGLMVFLIPGIILSFFLKGRIHHVRHLLKKRKFVTFSAIILGSASYYFMLRAFKIADITFVYPLIQLETIVVILGGIILLGEREHFWQKIIAGVIVVAGALIIGG